MSVSASSSGEHAPILTPSGSSGKKRPLRLLKKMLEEGLGKHLLLGLDVSSQFPEGVSPPPPEFTVHGAHQPGYHFSEACTSSQHTCLGRHALGDTTCAAAFVWEMSSGRQESRADDGLSSEHETGEEISSGILICSCL